MRLASKTDFETQGGLYWPPYQDFAYFRAPAPEELDRALGCLGTVADVVVHVVTPAMEPAHPAIVTARSAAEWRALLSPEEVLG